MARLPAISGAEAVKALTKAGWRVDRPRGSHVIMLKSGQIASLSVPQFPRIELRRIRAILRKTWTEPKLDKLLKALQP